MVPPARPRPAWHKHHASHDCFCQPWAVFSCSTSLSLCTAGPLYSGSSDFLQPIVPCCVSSNPCRRRPVGGRGLPLIVPMTNLPASQHARASAVGCNPRRLLRVHKLDLTQMCWTSYEPWLLGCAEHGKSTDCGLSDCPRAVFGMWLVHGWGPCQFSQFSVCLACVCVCYA
jgi:hypothetical protein